MPESVTLVSYPDRVPAKEQQRLIRSSHTGHRSRQKLTASSSPVPRDPHPPETPAWVRYRRVTRATKRRAFHILGPRTPSDGNASERPTKMIRDVTPSDADTVLEAAEQSGLFSAHELVVLRQQLLKALAGSSGREETWVAYFDNVGTAIGAALYAEEPFTDRVWNLLFIGVRRSAQGSGVGGELLRFVEDRLRARSQRILIIETTTGPELEGAHAFYRKHGYEHRGTIPDFYADGQDKIVFIKPLES